MIDPDILVGKPTIKGTRISVELVLKRLSQDLNLVTLFEAYPRLTEEDVKACLAYARAGLRRGYLPWVTAEHRRGSKLLVRFLFDENADRPLAEYLGSVGYDVTAVGRDYPHSISDVDSHTIARRERRIVVTNDHDFGELVFFRQLPHSGVILFRLKDEALATKVA